MTRPFTQRAIFPWLVMLSILVLLLVIFSPIVIVRSGHRGVATFFGESEGEIYAEGAHFKYPLLRIHQLDVRTKVVTVATSVTTQDMQLVNLETAVSYRLDDQKVRDIYAAVGRDAEDVYVVPAIKESLSLAATNFTAAELVSLQPEFTLAAQTSAEAELFNKHLILEDIVVSGLTFSDALQEAFEAKAVAEQATQTIRSQNDAAKLEVQRIETLGKALRGNEAFIEYELVRKWDGRSPLYLGSPTSVVTESKK